MLHRYRFTSMSDDPRPLEFPPPGPFWFTGYGGSDFSETIIVAYLPDEATLLRLWPEAENIEDQGEGEPVFNSRFQRPDWWRV